MTVNDISNRKTAIFSLKPVHEQMNVSDRYRALGNNTGNIVFDTALSELIDADRVYWDTPPDVLAQYDRFITTSYIWIRQNTPIPGILEPAGDRPLIPMSVGLQANDYDPGFQIHPEVVADLKKIEERCTIGCRGEYTAEILNRHGIRNLMVIGCPSVYAGIESGTPVRSLPSCKPQHAVSNFSTFWRKLKEHEARFLKYLAENRFSFIEQTAGELKEADWPEGTDSFRQVSRWLAGKKVFFTYSEWQEEIRKYDFSMGYRFHGNVMAVNNGIPSLFFYADSRVRELCEFFRFPMIAAREFTDDRPVAYWYEKSDYSEFNRRLPEKKRLFEEFCRKNGLRRK